MTPIDLKALPEKRQKKHQSSTPGGLIARLAVDDRYKGKGFGEWLLIDALRKLLAASNSVAFPVVIVAGLLFALITQPGMGGYYRLKSEVWSWMRITASKKQELFLLSAGKKTATEVAVFTLSLSVLSDRERICRSWYFTAATTGSHAGKGYGDVAVYGTQAINITA